MYRLNNWYERELFELMTEDVPGRIYLNFTDAPVLRATLGFGAAVPDRAVRNNAICYLFAGKLRVNEPPPTTLG